VSASVAVTCRTTGSVVRVVAVPVKTPVTELNTYPNGRDPEVIE
jgi:hypothetical protein